eukprot:tig00000076_g2311.t1
MLGRGLLELVAPEDRTAAEALFSRALRGGEEAAGGAAAGSGAGAGPGADPVELCLRVPQAGGGDIRLLLSATPRRDARGAVAYTIHELRTPLNGVLGLGELLGETSLDEEQRDLAHAIHTCSEQVRRAGPARGGRGGRSG